MALRNRIAAAVSALAVLAMAGAASAASIVFADKSTVNPTSGPLTYSTSGVTVNITASRFDAATGALTSGTALIANYNGGGLGVCSSYASSGSGDVGNCNNAGTAPFDTHYVDGLGYDEMVLFDFGASLIELVSITFKYNDSNDDFSFRTFGGTYTQTIDVPGSSDVSTYTFPTGGSFVRPTGSIFGIGAAGDNDEFKIKAITFNVLPRNPPEVPLPAGALLLPFALGGFAVIRRRRKA